MSNRGHLVFMKDIVKVWFLAPLLRTHLCICKRAHESIAVVETHVMGYKLLTSPPFGARGDGGI
jgi:hypothetical protein